MITPPVSHKKVQVVMTIENGQVINTRNVRDNELIASMDTFFWMARRAGYQVIPPENENLTGARIMNDKRITSAIDQAFRRYPTPVGPVYFVERNGWKRRTLSREAALNSLAYYMVVDVFLLFGWPLRYPDIPLSPGHVQRGDLTAEYREAHERCVRRLRRILARKREMQKWLTRWDAFHNRTVKERAELQASKPREFR
ncbi:hypothetical protein QBX66_21575 [Salmonella enterica subsp. diarizonae serovar 48:i:z]|nr:hypothetical protein [Salmonella enterica]WGI52396.1 hypothetical protein QBX66_21575 [Salmonella enterica subsp. diarizonae serovar 48:i:z]